MKIAIVSPWTVKPNSVGGTERFVIDLAESFAHFNHYIDVYMLSGDEYTKNGVNYKNINLFGDNRVVDEYFLRKEFNEFNFEESFVALAKKIEEKINFDEYDFVHLNSQLFIELAKSCRRIFTIHTNPFEYQLDWGDKSFKIMLKLMKDNFLTNKTIFVTPSKYYAKIYEELSGVNINFIPHAIDTSRLKCNKSKEEIYKEMEIPMSKKIILLPSRLEPIQKQPMLFMKAFALQRDGIKKKYKVICTGADKQYEQFKSEILAFANNNNIDVSIKRFEMMADGYKASDIVVLPSKSESFGYSALEALSLGITTIINNIPTYVEISDKAKNCYIFDNSVESLNSVLNLVLPKETIKKKQDKKWFEAYDINLFGRRYLELFDYDK